MIRNTPIPATYVAWSITPLDVKPESSNVTASASPENRSIIRVTKLDGKSGKIKAVLTYPGGVTKTVNIKVSRQK